MADKTVADLEYAHKKQLNNLIQALVLFHKLWADLAANKNENDPAWVAKRDNLYNFFQTTMKLLFQWMQRQFQYEWQGSVNVSNLVFQPRSNAATMSMQFLDPVGFAAAILKGEQDYMDEVARAIMNPTTFKQSWIPLATKYVGLKQTS